VVWGLAHAPIRTTADRARPIVWRVGPGIVEAMRMGFSAPLPGLSFRLTESQMLPSTINLARSMDLPLAKRSRGCQDSSRS
jgi:hypothetical protein